MNAPNSVGAFSGIAPRSCSNGFDGVVETGNFGIEFVGINVVLRDFRRAARDEVGVADGNAFARGYTV